MNCRTSEECSGKDVSWPLKDAKQLLFNSDQDYEETVRHVPHTCGRKNTGNSQFFVESPAKETEKPSFPAAPVAVAAQEAEVDLLAGTGQPAKADVDLDLVPGFSELAAAPVTTTVKSTPDIDLLQQTPPVLVGDSGQTQQGFDFLADFSNLTTQGTESSELRFEKVIN